MKPKTPKNLKKWHYSASGLWFGLHDLHWPFIFFLESLMSKKSSGMQKMIFWPLFHLYHFPNEIFQSRSLCDSKSNLPLQLKKKYLPEKNTNRSIWSWSCLKYKKPKEVASGIDTLLLINRKNRVVRKSCKLSDKDITNRFVRPDTCNTEVFLFNLTKVLSCWESHCFLNKL